jgi:hypothetical protein
MNRKMNGMIFLEVRVRDPCGLGHRHGFARLRERPRSRERVRARCVSVRCRSSVECRWISAALVLLWPMRSISSRRLAPASAVSGFPVWRRS